MILRQIVASAFACAILSTASWAEPLSTPTGPIVLEVRGQITHENGAGMAQFDLAMLQDLDWREIETYTSFTEGMQSFAGPTLASLLEAVGAQGNSMTATAINDYFVEIPVAHADQHGVILAAEMNGKRMRIRDKGPIWVIYPLSEDEAARKPFDTEMIWQLNRLEVTD